jgi:hypothetical protein
VFVFLTDRDDQDDKGVCHPFPQLGKFFCRLPGQVAQLVEQRTENPRVGSSILPLATLFLD